MSTLVTPRTVDIDDGPAITELHRLHRAQLAAYLADPFPNADTRRANLAALAGMIMGRRDEIHAAMESDFAVAPGVFTEYAAASGAES